MEPLKPLEEMAKDVKEGDFVRIHLRNSNYVGYRWGVSKENVKSQLMFPEDHDILFCGLDPYGVTNARRFSHDPLDIAERVQFVGVNLKTRKLGNEPITGYEVMERTKHIDGW